MQQGVAAFQKSDYAGALPFFRQVTDIDKNNAVAYNLAANCSLQLNDYPAAIDSFKHALQIQPDEFHNLSGLMRTYTLAGMAQERDALRAQINDLEDQKRLPVTFSYVFDSFTSGDKRVEITYFPQITGVYGFRYNFDVYGADGKEQFRVSLESDQMDQPLWAKQHPDEAAAGKRMFSLDGYQANTHSTFGFYSGEPSLDEVRGEVKQIVDGKLAPVSRTVRGAPNAGASPAGAQPAQNQPAATDSNK